MWLALVLSVATRVISGYSSKMTSGANWWRLNVYTIWDVLTVSLSQVRQVWKAIAIWPCIRRARQCCTFARSARPAAAVACSQAHHAHVIKHAPWARIEAACCRCSPSQQVLQEHCAPTAPFQPAKTSSRPLIHGKAAAQHYFLGFCISIPLNPK